MTAGATKKGDGLEMLTYEQLVGMLDELTAKMASGEVGIEEAADLYERARAVHRVATERLDAVRARVERLEGAAEEPED